MMINHIIFWGAQDDAHGTQTPRHSYLVISSPYIDPGTGIASVLPLTEGATFTDRYFIVEDGGESAAMEAAIKALEAEPANSRLNMRNHQIVR